MDQFFITHVTKLMLAREIRVLRTNRKGRRDRDVRDAVARKRPLDDLLARRGRRHPFSHVEVQHRAARVTALKGLLTLQGLERIVRESDRQLGRVRVVRTFLGAGVKNIGETLDILLRKPVRGPFCGRRLKVVEMPRFRLEFRHPRTDMIEELQREPETRIRRDVLLVSREIADTFVDPVHADRGEVITKGPKITLGVREKPLIDMALDDLAFQLEARFREMEEMIDAVIERTLVLS